MSAAYRMDSLLGNATSMYEIGSLEPAYADQIVDVWSRLSPQERASGAFYDVETEGQLFRRREEIAMLDNFSRRLADGPLNPMVASIAAAFAAPENYVPFLGLSRVAGGGARAAAKVVGANAAVQATLVEAAISQMQETRTFGESAANVLFAGAFGGALGGAAGAVGARRVRSAEAAVEEAAREIDTALAVARGELDPREVEFPRKAQVFTDEGWADILDDTEPPQLPAPKDTELPQPPAASPDEGSLSAARPAVPGAGMTDLKYSDADSRLVSTGDISRVMARMFDGLANMIGPHAQGAEAALRLLADDYRQRRVGLAETIGRLGDLGSVRGLAYWITPTSLRLMVSESPITRDLALRLFDVGMDVEGTVAGRTALATPVEQRIRGDVRRVTYLAKVIADEQFQQHVIAVKTAGGKPMSRVQFDEEIGRAMRRDTSHPDPNVDAAAKAMRDQIFNKILKNALKVQLRDIDPETGQPRTIIDAGILQSPFKINRYLTRAYDTAMIRKYKTVWEGMLRKHFSTHPDTAGMAPDEIEQLIVEVTSNILGGKQMNDQQRSVGQRGSMASRLLDIDDTEFDSVRVKGETISFLRSDVQEIVGRYAGSVISDIHIGKEFGTLSGLTSANDTLGEFAQKLLAEAKAKGEVNPEMAGIYLQRAQTEIDLIEQSFNNLRGMFNRTTPDAQFFVRTAQALRNWNFMRLMGFSALSSIPDLGRVVLMEGVTRSHGVAAEAMRGDLTKIKASQKVLARMGNALDVVMATTAKSIMDLGTGASDLSMVERALNSGSRLFATITLQNHVNQIGKQFAGAVVMDRIFDIAQRVAKGSDVSETDLRNAAQSGLSAKDLKAIAEQFDLGMKQGWADVYQDLRLSDPMAWNNPALATRFMRAVSQDVDNIIITPGAGDRPMFANSEVGKTLLQFKTFMFAANQRTMIRAAQRGGAREAAILHGIGVMMGLGLLSSWARSGVVDYIENREESTFAKMSTSQLILNAIDRAGLVPYLMEADNQFGAIAGTHNNLQGILTGAQAERFSSRGVIANVLGPSAGLIEEAARTALYINQKEEMNYNDERRIRRLLPGQNFPPLHFIYRDVLGLGIPDEE